MTMVSSYFAQVGVQLDTRSLRSTQAYFKNIERIMMNFQRRATRVQAVNLKFKIDRTLINKQLQTTMNRLSNNVVVPIKRFDINRRSLVRAINNAIPSNAAQSGSVRIGLRIAQSSLSGMRSQIRSSLEGVVIRPRINPIVTRGMGAAARGGSTSSSARGDTNRSPHRTSPWHNPMMVGGGAGAFMRYGFYSLPFVGGVMGLNNMSHTIQEYRAQETGLSFAAGMVSDPTKDVSYYRKYLHSVGERTGIRESLLSRDFHQMLAGSAGTEMEPHLEEGFQGLTQYAAILGLSEDSMRLVMRGVTQMIGKGKIQAEEARRQVGEQIPTFMRILGEQAAGGDMAKLDKMFTTGELHTAKYLPSVLREMKRQSDEMMGEYWSSLPYLVNQARNQQELWMRDFAKSGAEEGLASFWAVWAQIVRDSISSAETIGRLFERIAKDFSGALLIPQEMQRWINGEVDVRNFWVALFGDFDKHEEIQGILKEYITLRDTLTSGKGGNPFTEWKTTLKEIEAILRGVNYVLSSINNSMEGFSILRKEGVDGYLKHKTETQDVEVARGKAREILSQTNPNYTEGELISKTSEIYNSMQSERAKGILPNYMQATPGVDPVVPEISLGPLGHTGGLFNSFTDGIKAGMRVAARWNYTPPNSPSSSGVGVVSANSNAPQNVYSPNSPMPLNQNNIHGSPQVHIGTLTMVSTGNPEEDAATVVKVLNEKLSQVGFLFPRTAQ